MNAAAGQGPASEGISPVSQKTGGRTKPPPQSKSQGADPGADIPVSGQNPGHTDAERIARRDEPTKNRPRGGASPAGPTTTTFPASSIPENRGEWDEYARQIDGAFCVVVKTAGGRYRRRVWLTLAPAERAAQKAIDAGHSATVVLAELKPLYRITGGGADA